MGNCDKGVGNVRQEGELPCSLLHAPCSVLHVLLCCGSCLRGYCFRFDGRETVPPIIDAVSGQAETLPQGVGTLIGHLGRLYYQPRTEGRFWWDENTEIS